MYNHPYYNQAQDYIKSIGFNESELFTKAFLAGVNARDNDLSDMQEISTDRAQHDSGYNYYVNVSVMDYIDNNGSKKTERNFEKLDEAKYTEFIQNNSTVEENGKIKEIKYFTCTEILPFSSTISQSNITGRVYQITFKAN